MAHFQVLVRSREGIGRGIHFSKGSLKGGPDILTRRKTVPHFALKGFNA